MLPFLGFCSRRIYGRYRSPYCLLVSFILFVIQNVVHIFLIRYKAVCFMPNYSLLQQFWF
jgi:hypothetical protein